MVEDVLAARVHLDDSASEVPNGAHRRIARASQHLISTRTRRTLLHGACAGVQGGGSDRKPSIVRKTKSRIGSDLQQHGLARSQHTVTAHRHSTPSHHMATAHGQSTPPQHKDTARSTRPSHTVASCRHRTQHDAPRRSTAWRSRRRLLGDRATGPGRARSRCNASQHGHSTVTARSQHGHSTSTVAAW